MEFKPQTPIESSQSIGIIDPAIIPDQVPQVPSEIVNDISKQISEKEGYYTLREWVTSKLDQIKQASSLNVEAHIVPESIRIQENIISIDVKTDLDKIATMELKFFQDGIVMLKCLNPQNPSKFSFELVDKPDNLVAYSVETKVTKEENHFEVDMGDLETKIVVSHNPFNVTLVSTKDDMQETLFEMNTNKSLKFDENLTADFTFHTEYVYGLPERAQHLMLEDTKQEMPYRFYNQDIPGYSLNSKNSLYGAVPVVVSRKRNSSTFVSMYWQNTSDTYIDVHRYGPSSKTYWLSERGNLECYIFVNRSQAAHFKSMANVLGHCAMPQYFALGYHQCRWSYKDQQDLLHVNDKFNEHEIPCDTLTLDIDHTDGCRYFTWNEELFPDPVNMQDILAQDGRQLVTIADPHIKVDEDYSVYKEAIEQDLCVKTSENKTFVGKCWPGDSVYLDFLNEETRNSWASQYSHEKYKMSGSNLWAWNDMNEPSVFEMKGNHMPLDNLQTYKSIENPENTFQVEHREVHNIYGYCQHKATYDGMLKRDKDQNIRPHVLSRSFYAGSQKWTTVWTGDTCATWDYLKVTVPQMLSLSLCGISNNGGDVGGFIGNPEPELAVRWYQLGAFMPYFRAHSEATTERREPWLYEKKYYEIIRETIRDRYRFLPYWYTCFEDHCRTGMPVLRPIWLDQDQIADEMNMFDQERFMVGDGLMVSPILEPGKNAVTGALKGLQGRWYDYYTKKEMMGDEEVKTGLERIGCFVKGGNVIPTFDIRSYIKSSKDARASNVSLNIGLNEDETARGKMYFDDGETFNYKKGTFARKTIEFQQDTLVWNGEEGDGFTPNNRVTKAMIMGVNSKYNDAYLYQGNHAKQKIHMAKTVGGAMLEFVAKAKRNWRIVLH